MNRWHWSAKMLLPRLGVDKRLPPRPTGPRLVIEMLESRLAPSATTPPGIGNSVMPESPPTSVPRADTREVVAHQNPTPVGNNPSDPTKFQFEHDSNGALTVIYPDGLRSPIQYDNDGRPYTYDPHNAQLIYIDDSENVPAIDPTMVSGCFLTEARSVTAPASFTDVAQGESATCSFAATLSAVARTSFNLETGIVLQRRIGVDDLQFGVRLYRPDAAGVYKPTWISVEFDGTIYPSDLHSTDGTFWPVLYQRAYLTYQQETGGIIGSVGQAFRALTGKDTGYFSPAGDPRSAALQIRDALNNGKPVIASSRDDGPLLLDRSGLVHDHAYAVLGVEIPASGSTGIYVTLRNPWAQDTDWSYFDADHDGHISTDEYLALQYGLDGNNDGIIRVAWATFANDFTNLVVGNQTGPPSNQPLSNRPPVFKHAALGPYTIFEGEKLGPIDASAKDPEGQGIFYSLRDGTPGDVQLQSGQYTWVPAPGDAGTHLITVVAETSPFESATLTFRVNVVTANPRVGDFECDRAAITTSGSDPIKLTATNVATDFGTIDRVEFWRDTNHNGVFDDSQDGDPNDVDDVLLGTGTLGSDGYTWTGYLGNLSVGTERIFARAVRLSSSGTFYSPIKSVTLQVGPAPVVPALVSKAGPEVRANVATPGSQEGSWVNYDQSSNLSAVYYDPQVAQGYLRRFDPAGAQIGATTALTQVQGPISDVAMLPDGHLVVLWVQSGLRAREFNPDGTPFGTTYLVNPNSGDYMAPGKVAISAPGEFAVALAQGTYGSAKVYFYRYSRGSLLQSQVFQADSSLAGLDSVDLAMDPAGACVVGWLPWSSGSAPPQATAQRITATGALFGSAFSLGTVSGVGYGYNPANNLAIAVDDRGRFVAAWAANGDIYARRFLADGTPVDAQEFRVNSSLAGDQTSPLVEFRNGCFVVAFTTDNAAAIGQAYIWKNSLRPLGGNFPIASAYARSLALDARGSNFAVGYEGQGTGDSYGAFFQRFTGLEAAAPGFGLRSTPPRTGDLTTLAEGLPIGSPVGDFESNNPGSWSYRLVAGDGSSNNDAFAIEGGVLKTNAAVDFEAKDHYSIRVRATPETGVAVEQVFDVGVADTLGGDGTVITRFSVLAASPTDAGRSVAIQADGKVVVAGYSVIGGKTDFAVARYDSDGSLDATFGGDGTVVTAVGNGFDAARDVAVQADGKIVVAGTSFNGTNYDFAVVRYNPDGSLDASFDGDGIVTTAVGAADDNASSVAVQPDGKIVVGGSAMVGGKSTFALVRYNSGGGLDSSFDGDGKLTTAVGTGDSASGDVAVQPDGRILVGGSAVAGGKYNFALVRYNADGSLDSSFDGDGQVVTAVGTGDDRGFGVAVQPDGKVVLGGSSSNGNNTDFAVARYNADGSRDSSFAGTGTVTTAVGTGDGRAYGVALESDGKIVLNGSSSNGGSSDFALVRYNTDGTLDTTLDGDGKVGVDLGGNDLGLSMQLTPDGQAVIGGYRQTAAIYEFALARVDLDGAPTAGAVGPTTGVVGQALGITLHAHDPALVDQVAGFKFSVDWDGDGTVDQTVHGPDGLTVQHAFDTPGSHTFRVTATDQDGDASAPATFVVSTGVIGTSPDPLDPGKTDLVIGGTARRDSIAVTPGAAAGTFAVTVNKVSLGEFAATGRILVYGQAGNDTIIVSPAVTLPALFDGGPGNDRLTAGGGDTTLVGGQGVDVLRGGAGTDTVAVQASGAFVLKNFGLANPLGRDSLKDIENAYIVGGMEDDSFNVSGWTGTRTAVLDGGPGRDKIVSSNDSDFTLSDTLLVRAPSVFHLTSIEAADLTGGAGDNNISASGFSGFAYFDGRAGDDVLVGSTGGSVLLGGTGNDSIWGQAGRDVIFGGSGADTLAGGDGDDILVAGRGLFDASRKKVGALFDYWGRGDLDYSNRVNTLTGGHLLPPAPKVGIKSIADDRFTDRLSGGGGVDWFFGKTSNPFADSITDLDSGAGERIN